MESMIVSVINTLPFFLVLFSYIPEGDEYSKKRWEMIEGQIISRGIRNSKVIQAMLRVPRHEFILKELRHLAYEDGPVQIGLEQTISQPYIVALMTELLTLKEGNKVLEVGTGSGYQTAILADMGCEVFTIEILGSLQERSKAILASLGYNNIHYKVGDGYKGWEEELPFDAIIVTAAPSHVPKPLTEQLKLNGKMVIPVGDENQELLLIKRTEGGTDSKTVTPVRFVPMTGEAEKQGQN